MRWPEKKTVKLLAHGHMTSTGDQIIFLFLTLMSTDVLLDLLRGYSALLPVTKLVYPRSHPFLEIHDFVIENILLSAHLALYPPSTPYQQSFFKWILGCLEEHLGDQVNRF